MTDIEMGGLSPMSQPTPALGQIRYFGHAQLWKRRRLRLEAEKGENPTESAIASAREDSELPTILRPPRRSPRRPQDERPRPPDLTV